MTGTVFEKIVSKHLIRGKMQPGEEVLLRVDQTLTQDSTGTLVYLEFEKMGVDRVRTELSVSYVDHNMLQTDYKNPDDHLFLQSMAMRYGVYFSRPGNGICHQVHLERFSRPGKTLLGSDSHTPTAGGVGMLAIGAGGLNVAAAMAGIPFRLRYPEIIAVKLNGRLRPWVSAKDVALYILGMIGVKGGVGKVFEFLGQGVKTLTVPERATITNMLVETGATTSLFPSDEQARRWLALQERVEQWVPLKPDDNAVYDEVLEIELGDIEPLVAMPHSPDNVKPVSDVEGLEVRQVAIGSCTNSSYKDLKTVANIMRGKKVHENLHLLINPGSRQVVLNLIASGDYFELVRAGARILENACGPCIGMGGAPPSNSYSVRTYNRNFKGRSGTLSAGVILSSPETAAATAITGVLMDPRSLGDYPRADLPEKLIIDDSMIIPPLPREEAVKVKIIRGPNIKPLPEFTPLPPRLEGRVLAKLGDNVTTDDILPAGASILPLRSNIEAISKYVFKHAKPGFYEKALENRGGFIVGGENYGQGSSREHAALAPRYLGIRMVLAKSFARIHRENLVNFGVIPALFIHEKDYERIDEDDYLVADLAGLSKGFLIIENKDKNYTFKARHDLSQSELEILLEGGLLPWIRSMKGGI